MRTDLTLSGAERGRLPNFAIVGAMKGGTTSLYHILRSHPEVFMCTPKEPSFFVAEHAWDRGLGWYAGLFAEAGSAAAVGEASTNYTKYPAFAGVPDRMHDAIPDVRIIYLVRDPLERMRSHYLHNLARTRERRSFEEAVRSDPIYLDCSRYTTQLAQFRRRFPAEQILVVTSDSLISGPASAVRPVFEHIGVDPEFALDGPAVHHRTADKRRPRRGMSSLRRSPLAGLASSVLPAPAWQAVKRRLTDQVDPAQAVITGDMRAELEPELVAEVAGLREYLGPQFDGWGIG
jgi:hypothetical protein